MAEYLSDDQIDTLVEDRMREEARAFLTLGTLFDSRVTFIARDGRARYMPTAEACADDSVLVAFADATARHEPAALMHAYWKPDPDGPASGIVFAVQVHVEDGCAAYVWLADGFEREGDGVYSPGPEATLTEDDVFDDIDTDNDPRLAAAWPWTIGFLADWVFSVAEE